MLSWLFANLATIVIALVLAVIVGAIVVRMVSNKKKGKSSCGCGCANCAMRDACAGTPPRANPAHPQL